MLKHSPEGSVQHEYVYSMCPELFMIAPNIGRTISAGVNVVTTLKGYNDHPMSVEDSYPVFQVGDTDRKVVGSNPSVDKPKSEVTNEKSQLWWGM